MESKVLNFPDAMKLAEILDKYSIMEEDDGIGRATKLINSITPEEYLIMLGICGINVKLAYATLAFSAVSVLLSREDLDKMLTVYRGMSNG